MCQFSIIIVNVPIKEIDLDQYISNNFSYFSRKNLKIIPGLFSDNISLGIRTHNDNKVLFYIYN
jgi:hypothetical protein